MKTLFWLFAIIALPILTCLGQQKKSVKPKFDIKFIFSDAHVTDSASLVLKVIYHNTSKDSIEIYQYLQEGDKNDRFFNIFIEMQE